MTRADALVLFGATGDLARKKLFGALYRLEAQHRLDLPVIGVAPSDWDDERFRTPWAAMMAMLLAISASVLDGSGLGLSVQLRNTALRSEKSRSLLTMTRSVSSGLAGRPRQPGRAGREAVRVHFRAGDDHGGPVDVEHVGGAQVGGVRHPTAVDAVLEPSRSGSLVTICSKIGIPPVSWQ